jgi:2-dehydro-3-deoxyglucarate aldolase/4-hydroxy-2-oxoheptanedioate aldolase
MAAPAASFRERVRAGEPLLGTFLQLGSSVAAEIAAQAGFDWLLVDLEHGSATEATLLADLQAIATTGASALVRVESTERIRIGRALDAGAQGIMVPRIGSAEQAQQVVRALRYPPEGVRGVALGTRSASFGRATLNQLSALNQQIVGILQIESRESVEAVEAIAAIDGVDVLFIGPSDLSVALGVPGQLEHPRFGESLERIVAAARRHGKAVGTLLRNAGEVEATLRQGITFIGISSEASQLAAALRGLAREARAALPLRADA